MGLGRMTSNLFTHSNLHETNLLVPCLSTFGVRTSQGQPWTHKTHHGLDSGEATTFPHIVYSAPLREAHIQMALCPRTPKGESRNSKVGAPPILRGYNSTLRPSIGMRSEAKLLLSSKVFQRHVARHLYARGSDRFLTFCAGESNCQFDSRPFFLPQLVLYMSK